MVARDIVRRLLEAAGTTYCTEAGIRLTDRPMPLFQLMMFSLLAAKPIRAEIAVTAARELFDSGVRMPKNVLRSDRSTIIDALDRAGYARYDESTADRLAEMADLTMQKYDGDLRLMGRWSNRDVAAARAALMEFPGMGETAAAIFLREVQDTWTWVRPCFDEHAVAGARRLKLPTTPARLGSLAPGNNAGLAAALVRVSMEDELSAQLLH
jgi:endonuclease III